jgi:prophage regulatory protein
MYLSGNAPNGAGKEIHMERLHKIVRLNELPAFVGLRRTQIDELVKQGQFPRPVKLSARRKGWLEHELISWQQARIAERDR